MVKKVKCPKCNGPTEVVRRWGDGTIAYRCVRGHKEKSTTGEECVRYPVYIIAKK